ncbi:Uncharacterized conserved protein [Mycobacteroides abscessus]|uniref:DUF2303 family protein n=1 Tax=Mycobacteroides abscessus TaxID=36809 RepID=UPI0005E04F4F|nr:DUF2303 family protein [Mycobacteroides abscessus]CPX18452.1 Uncharacterized conserved protein [Mycobacteroides abscessus]CRG60445.1 Uncharacterized conserved protein [Mycobacteroides abscessus]
MTDEIRTEADAVAELTNAAERYSTEQVVPDTEHVLSYVTNSDEHRDFDSLERYLPNPRRDRGTTTVLDVDSFNKLIDGALHLDAVAYADRGPSRITAVLNDKGWRDHRIVVALQLSREWNHWAAADGKLLNQIAFAEHIEDGLAAITSPPAADLMEVVQNFQTKRKVEFQSGHRTQSGEVQFQYKEEATATAGGKGGHIEVPEHFTLRIPVYERGDVYDLTARLRFRIGQDGLLLGYKLDRAGDVKDVAFDAEVAKLAVIKSVFGPAPDTIREL